jgi:hypothetical protein
LPTLDVALGEVPMNFEIVLDRSGTIRFNYGSGNSGFTPTIGISGGVNQPFYLAPHDHQRQLTNVQSVLWVPLEDPTDQDADGYASPGSPICPHPQTDCDDGNPNVNPGRAEIPGNGIDDDCNAATPAGCEGR